jgi:hypothetical protein
LYGTQLGKVLQVSKIWLVQAQLSDVFQGILHLFHFSGRQEGERIPVPLVVGDVGVKSHGAGGSHQMVRKAALAPRQNVDLLSSFR